MPKPVRELLRLVHVEQIDLSQVKRVDFEIISYLKESHPDLYRSLRRAVRSKHRHPEGEPAMVDGDSVLRSYPETADEPDRRQLQSPLFAAAAASRTSQFAPPCSFRAARSRRIACVSFVESAPHARIVRLGAPAPARAERSRRPPRMAEQQRVIWFDRLRMSDVDQVGGKNASLGEMIAQLGRRGDAGSGRLRDDRVGVSRVSGASGSGRAHRDRAGRRSTSTTSRSSPASARRSAAGSSAAPLPAALKAEIETRLRTAQRRQPRRICRRPLVGHGRGHARRLVRRPAGDIP